ncbi:MAG TPA: maleylpyruvate isomerase N-terminal domain-containing protein [Streptosporangiaceae bacterium]|nr:maleylpyruvate isomerase N-terminal domain-containing protein [Streptosporangiaceae bacterium]
MASYASLIDTLDAELTAVLAVFRGVAPEDWERSTRLVPVDPDLPHWTVFELAGHFDISIGLTRMLIAAPSDERPGRDRTSFFINPRSETGPVVYSYAYAMVDGKVAADMPGVLAETFGKAVHEARAVRRDRVGPGYFAPMRVDEFVASRIVEAVVHGIDLSEALGIEYVATAPGIAVTAAILDDLLARRTVGARPPELADDLDWILAASGRAESADNRLPLIG